MSGTKLRTASAESLAHPSTNTFVMDGASAPSPAFKKRVKGSIRPSGSTSSLKLLATSPSTAGQAEGAESEEEGTPVIRRTKKSAASKVKDREGIKTKGRLSFGAAAADEVRRARNDLSFRRFRCELTLFAMAGRGRANVRQEIHRLAIISLEQAIAAALRARCCFILRNSNIAGSSFHLLWYTGTNPHILSILQRASQRAQGGYSVHSSVSPCSKW